jgi:hypothetical protein
MGRDAMKLTRWRTFLLLAVFFLLSECATPSPKEAVRSWERPEACQEFLDRLDARIREEGVGDAAFYPIPGFPYLRADRFLSALKDRAKNEAEREQVAG